MIEPKFPSSVASCNTPIFISINLKIRGQHNIFISIVWFYFYYYDAIKEYIMISLFNTVDSTIIISIEKNQNDIERKHLI